jgi:hypothetical protein
VGSTGAGGERRKKANERGGSGCADFDLVMDTNPNLIESGSTGNFLGNFDSIL